MIKSFIKKPNLSIYKINCKYILFCKVFIKQDYKIAILFKARIIVIKIKIVII